MMLFPQRAGRGFAMLFGLCVGVLGAGGVFADENRTTIGGFTGPTSLAVTCGDISMRIDGTKLWTPSGLDYRGTRLAIEESAYGSVFNIEGVGFIGSAHRENETEQITDVQFFLDGEPVDGLPTHLEGRSFRCERRSRIRDLELHSTVEIIDGQFRETARVRAHRDVRLAKVYHFMHAWISQATHYAYGRGDEIVAAGEFSNAVEDDRRFYAQQNVDWVAVYDAQSQKGAVSYLHERPEAGGSLMQLWNCIGVYRKFYLATHVDQTMPAGFDGTYRMTTAFFDTSADKFEKNAKRVAGDLSRQDQNEK